jgi:uncharacterized membrane protein
MHARIPPSPHAPDPALLAHAAQRWLGRTAETLSDAERRVLGLFLQRHALARSAAPEAASPRLGERVADRVARFGGSWTFIGLFALVLVAWVLLNAAWLRHPYDPYPFVFLNLLLSMLAAIQAPVIMMSQNRQSAKDRADAENDYAVNLKAELEILALHDKLDALRIDRIESLLEGCRDDLARLSRNTVDGGAR